MNRFFEGNDFNVIYRDMAKQLMLEPEYEITNKDGSKLHELLNVTFKLTDSSKCFAHCRGMSMFYLLGELEFYFSGSPYLKDIVKYSKFWNKVSDDGKTITSNYGRLLLFDRNSSNLTQFEYAKKCLINNPESKKAVMVIYNKDHSKKSKDNPCTMHLQFFIRDNKLHLFVKMRSSDIWFGIPYDVPFFCLIQNIMAYSLGVEVGSYNHNSGSLHLYLRNLSELSTNLSFKDKENDSLFEELFVRYREVICE